MLKNTLGKTGLNVSKIGFGGIPIQRLTQEQATSVIKELKNQGINFIDTANGYTVSEGYIGNALKEVGRENFYLATKAMGYTYESMKAFIEKSLNDLGVEYIDLYQIHNCSKEEQFANVISENGAFKALKEAKDKGLIKHVGVTSHNVTMLEKFLEYDIIETIQFPFNIVEQQAIELFQKAKAKNVAVIAMKPLAGGAITDGELALKYILNSGLVTIAIPGMDSEEQVIKNASVANNLEPLTDEDNKNIERIRKELGNDFCRRCGYCMPCPQGIDIPGMFLFEGYATRYNLKDWAMSRYNALKIKADACVKCGLCETKCPYELPIRKKLENVVKVMK
ncbi:aldo/keto reductase [Sedimentibacter sp. zth1]|uniref:aldo/keto reductase n=1 Tax=Sedimentibacter sp. zth1 TaxID=2816908 RepID=UPI001A92A786|nr:aldo/keto reductase [Sedimentibacter sp. zth1]QSX05421.1 aldo/keto reductase [Sedimentibacter sp. zth1]